MPGIVGLVGLFSNRIYFGKASKSPQIFYGQAYGKGRGGGGVSPSALTVSKCENFDPFLH